MISCYICSTNMRYIKEVNLETIGNAHEYKCDSCGEIVYEKCKVAVRVRFDRHFSQDGYEYRSFKDFDSFGRWYCENHKDIIVRSIDSNG